MDRDLDGSSNLVQRLEAKAKHNSEITSREIHVLSLYVRQAVNTTKVNHHMIEFLLATLMALSALGQLKLEIALDGIPKKYEKAMGAISEYIKASARLSHTT